MRYKSIGLRALLIRYIIALSSDVHFNTYTIASNFAVNFQIFYHLLHKQATGHDTIPSFYSFQYNSICNILYGRICGGFDLVTA